MSATFCDIGEIASIQVLQQRIVEEFANKIYQNCENTDYTGHDYNIKLQNLKNTQYGVDYGSNTIFRNGKHSGRHPSNVRAVLLAYCKMTNTQILDTFDIYSIEAIKENLNGFLNEAKKVKVGDLIKLNTHKNPMIFNALCNFYLYNCIYKTVEGVHFESTVKGAFRTNDISCTQGTEFNMWLYKPLENYNIEDIDNLLDVFSVNADYTHPNPDNMIVMPYKF